MKRIGMASYRCSDLAEFAWLLSHPQIRSEILQGVEGEGAQLQAAIRAVELHVFKRIPYRSDGARFVMRLRHQGCGHEALAQALALAWLQGSDEFWLPRKRWHERLVSTWTLLGISLVLALLLTLFGMQALRQLSPEVDLYLLAFPPLLALIGFPLTGVIFMLLQKGVDVLLHAVGSREQRP